MTHLFKVGLDEIKRRFGSTATPPEGENLNHDWITIHFIRLADGIDDMLPNSREKALFMTALEEASMWSHKALARYQQGLNEEQLDDVVQKHKAESTSTLATVSEPPSM